MFASHYKYLLVGGGLTSASAADAIRRRDAAGSILLVGQEINRPYHRPRLSIEYLKREQSRSQIIVYGPEWFQERGVTLATGRRAVHLDVARHAVTLDSGQEIAFDRVLIATGAAARTLSVPGATLPGIFTLRTLADADRLHHAIEKAKVEGHRHAAGRGVAAVVGGSVLGIELATTLTQLGLAVHLILDAPYPWRKYAGDFTGKVIANHLINNGVSLHASPPRQIIGDGRAQRVVLADNENVACDFVITAVGVLPNKELLRGTTITSEAAILTDSHCRTNEPDVFAAGDCAAIFDPTFGKHRLIEHWDHARVVGAIAGANMAGEAVAYSGVNHFRCSAFDLPLQAWGEQRLVVRRHIRGDVTGSHISFIEVGVAADGQIAQILAVGHSNDEQLLSDLVRQRVTIDGNEELLKDTSQSLTRLLA